MRFHIGTDGNDRQNNLTIEFPEVRLKYRIRGIALDGDLTTLLETSDTAGNDRMAARRHNVVAMGGDVVVENAMILIAQDYQAVFSIAAGSADIPFSGLVCSPPR
jgi:hypothetical protein